MGASPPCNPPPIRLVSAAFGGSLEVFLNCGKEGRDGEENGHERAGARRDSLALRCPVTASQTVQVVGKDNWGKHIGGPQASPLRCGAAAHRGPDRL
jgi:hypothetical protein